MNKRLLPTQAEGISAHITIGKEKEGHKILTGYAVQAKTMIRVDGCGKHKRTVQLKNQDIDQELRFLANTIGAEYLKTHAPKSRTSKEDSAAGPFTLAYQDFRNSGIQNSNWGPSTRDVTLLYFEGHVLPFLDGYGSTLCSEDMEHIRRTLADEAFKSKRGNRNPDTALQSTDKYLYRINWILEQMYAMDSTLPKMFFPAEHRKNEPQLEQKKSLRDKVRVIFAAALHRLSPTGYAMGAAAMLLLGVRTSEACAIKIGDITLRDGWFVDCPILYQMKDGKRVPRLETDAGYRHAIGGTLMYELIVARKEYLRSIGYDESAIANMPLVNQPGNEEQFADPSGLAAFVKKLLFTCGFSKAQYRSASMDMQTDPELEKSEKNETEVSAYILRRDFITRAATVCGMSPVDIDAIVGHRNPDTAKRDYTNPDFQKTLATQLERYVFLPEHSHHPFFNAITVAPRESGDLENYSDYSICAGDQCIEVTLDLTTSECGQPITLRTDGELLKAVPIRAPLDSPEKRAGRPIIGECKSRAYYAELKEEAAKLDLSKFNVGGKNHE